MLQGREERPRDRVHRVPEATEREDARANLQGARHADEGEVALRNAGRKLAGPGRAILERGASARRSEQGQREQFGRVRWEFEIGVC